MRCLGSCRSALQQTYSYTCTIPTQFFQKPAQFKGPKAACYIFKTNLYNSSNKNNFHCKTHSLKETQRSLVIFPNVKQNTYIIHRKLNELKHLWIVQAALYSILYTVNFVLSNCLGFVSVQLPGIFPKQYSRSPNLSKSARKFYIRQVYNVSVSCQKDNKHYLL